MYGVDLAGAAFGGLGALALISVTDGPSVVLWAAAMGAAASYAFARSAGGTRPVGSPALGWLADRRGLILGATCLAALANGLTDRGLVPQYVKGHFEGGPPLFLKWNSFSRVVMSDTYVDVPQMWGPSPTFSSAEWRLGQRHLNIDGEAGTVAYGLGGDIAKAEFLKYDVTNFAHYLPGHRSGAIIGVGGGRDMIAARLFGSLVRAGVNVKAIAQGSSERNISVVIDGADATRALRAAHAGFYLSQQTLSIGVIGHGHVGLGQCGSGDRRDGGGGGAG